MAVIKHCKYCKKELINRQKKYCDDLCQYRYLSILNDMPKASNLSQQIRINRVRNIGKKDARYL